MAKYTLYNIYINISDKLGGTRKDHPRNTQNLLEFLTEFSSTRRMRIIKNYQPSQITDNNNNSNSNSNTNSNSTENNILSNTEIEKSTSPTKVSRKRRRVEDEGYNSEDEYTRHSRVKDNLNRSKNLESQYVEPELLAAILSKCGLRIAEMAKDGNCMFRSIAHQIFGDPERHMEVRKSCTEWMLKERNHFSQFITEDFELYIERKKMETTYGNHLELQAVSEVYNRPIHVYSNDEKPMVVAQGNYTTQNNLPIRLSYHYGNHYNSVYDPKEPVIGIGIGLKPDEAENKMMETVLKETERDKVEDEYVSILKQETENDVIEKQIIEQLMMTEENEKIEKHMIEEARKLSELDQLNVNKGSGGVVFEDYVDDATYLLMQQQQFVDDDDFELQQAIALSTFKN
eukprot:TRINITY_DN5322_c0_g2_i1.p2 TRINITY_DN5322_c0_g2~~TRINITY_DN5322_c0_g2_i1.p2  ORF type:complete len:401 (-),score=70.19 TRINITY_DN5322_c0_g2_i1:42-1244(-)